MDKAEWETRLKSLQTFKRKLEDDIEEMTVQIDALKKKIKSLS